MKLEVIMPGAMTTIQDEGRIGYQEYGMTQSGVMDADAYHLANSLAGNNKKAAVLEMTVFGGSFKAEGNGICVLTGADMPAVIKRGDEKIEVSMNQPFELHNNDELELGMVKSGCRTYLALRGGIEAEIVMGSRSTNLKCHIGGYKGRALKSGDAIESGSMDERPCRQRTEGKKYKDNEIIRFVFGPQDDYFSESEKNRFQNEIYRISDKSDRMGYRLEGYALKAEHGVDIVSDGIVYGSIQIPSNGQPIVLMADHQTTGGYAKIGTVCSFDLPKLAQMMPGSRIQFKAISVEEAQQILINRGEEEL